MKIFIACIVGVIAFDCLGKIVVLAITDGPLPRSRLNVTLDLVINLCLLVWASVLLWGDA